MAKRVIKSRDGGYLIAVIGDEDTATGFLLAGVGDNQRKSGPNFFVVDPSTIPSNYPFQITLSVTPTSSSNFRPMFYCNVELT